MVPLNETWILFGCYYYIRDDIHAALRDNDEKLYYRLVRGLVCDNFYYDYVQN